jgi:hypothetical protein
MWVPATRCNVGTCNTLQFGYMQHVAIWVPATCCNVRTCNTLQCGYLQHVAMWVPATRCNVGTCNTLQCGYLKHVAMWVPATRCNLGTCNVLHSQYSTTAYDITMPYVCSLIPSLQLADRISWNVTSALYTTTGVHANDTVIKITCRMRENTKLEVTVIIGVGEKPNALFF